VDPSTLLIGKGIDAAAMLGGKFLGGMAPMPNVSSAYQANTMSAPFNVGGSAVAGGSITGVLSSYGPLIVVAAMMWLASR
jgi:hypothetical protein